MGLVKREGTWCFQYWVNRKRHVKSLATSDKREADQRAEKFRKALRAQRCGFDSYDETEARPFAELVDDYAKELKRRGRSEGHAEKVKRRILVLCRGVRSVLELTTDRIRSRLADLAETGTERGGGFKGRIPAKPFSGKTSNDYRAALHGLFSHLVKSALWPENPVMRVERSKHEQTRERSALTTEQLEAFFAFVKTKRLARSVLYRLAANTGLRRSELKALRWSAIDLEAAELVLGGKHTKNKKEARLPLNVSTVAALRELLEEQKEDNNGEEVLATAPVFTRIPLVRTLYTDLKNAGLQKTERFEGVDLHALRTAFVTNLGRAGVSLAQAQKLARHSTPVLTANVYTKLELVDAHEAVAKLERRPEETPDNLRGRDRVLSDGPRDTKVHQPALTRKKARKNSKNDRASEAAQNKASEAMHPAGFEPARWGSKPRVQARDRKGLGEEGVVPSGGQAARIEAVARQLLEHAAAAEDPTTLLAAAQELLEEAKRERAKDGKVRKLHG